MFDLNDKSSILNAFLDESTGIHQEDPELNIQLAEAMFMSALTQEELQELTENTKEMNTLIEEGILSEKTIVKFDKTAKLSKAESQAVLIIAREKNDRDFFKLVRVWKMRKILKDKLEKKYGSQAKARAKQMIRNSAKSKSKTANKVAKRTR